jgi:hypothetical protein
MDPVAATEAGALVPFQFMKLPTEIRLKVYDHWVNDALDIYPGLKGPQWTSDLTIDITNEGTSLCHWQKEDLPATNNLALVRTCRQVYFEAMPVLHSRTDHRVDLDLAKTPPLSCLQVQVPIFSLIQPLDVIRHLGLWVCSDCAPKIQEHRFINLMEKLDWGSCLHSLSVQGYTDDGLNFGIFSRMKYRPGRIAPAKMSDNLFEVCIGERLDSQTFDFPSKANIEAAYQLWQGRVRFNLFFTGRDGEHSYALRLHAADLAPGEELGTHAIQWEVRDLGEP